MKSSGNRPHMISGQAPVRMDGESQLLLREALLPGRLVPDRCDFRVVGIVPLAVAGAATNELLDGSSTEPAMTTNPNATETNMISSTLDETEFLSPRVSGGRSAAALRFLMRDWERDGLVDDGESESELMELVCGMVSASDVVD